LYPSFGSTEFANLLLMRFKYFSSIVVAGSEYMRAGVAMVRIAKRMFVVVNDSWLNALHSLLHLSIKCW
jgi:hypothetical protein